MHCLIVDKGSFGGIFFTASGSCIYAFVVISEDDSVGMFPL